MVVGLDYESVVVRGMWDGKKVEKYFKVMDCNEQCVIFVNLFEKKDINN